jgi:tRNA A58 N-methylase Trm61
MLVLAELKPGEIVYDLGSGDGRVVIMAAQEFGAKAVGVELRGDLARRALNEVMKVNLESEVKIVQDDLFNIDISTADIVTLYLTTSANKKIKPKLESELKPGARVVSHDYAIPGWKTFKLNKFCENQNLEYPSHTIYVYKI